MMKIRDLFHFEKGSLQSTKCVPGEYNFITAAADWKTHNEFTHDCEALIFAAAASGSLGRTHYVRGKFITSDLCFVITPKDPKNYPIDLKFYHLLFQTFKGEIVRNTKAGTSKEAIGLTAFGKFELPYFDFQKQVEVRQQFLAIRASADVISHELTYQLVLVKQLRQAFLREAMQGKLVPQNPKDGHANDLLKKIKTEKAAVLQANGKKEKPLPSIKGEEIPFVIPESWVWCRLGEICSLITSGSRNWNKYYSKDGALFIRSQNIKPGSIDLKSTAYVKLPVSTEGKRTSIAKGDILITITGAGVSNSAVLENIDFEEAYVSQHIALSRIALPKVAKWVHHCVISTSIGGRQFSDLIYGDKPGLNLTQIANIFLPLPPLTEQQRIIAKLDQLMQYCDALEASIKSSRQQDEVLLQQVFREALKPGESESNREKVCDSSEKAILAGHIINSCNNVDFGRVKFQKLLHLAEYHCKVNMGSHYVQKVAGPHDEQLITELESTLKRYQFYKITRTSDEGGKITYTPLSSARQLGGLFQLHFRAHATKIDQFLAKFKNSTWKQCEIISTLYAVWNNRIIRNQMITDDLLKEDFLAWDAKKIKYAERLDKALDWMRKEGIVPDGWGRVIEKPIEMED